MSGETRLFRLFSNTASYTVASFLQSGVSFLLIPFYTRSMSKAEFGAMDQIVQAMGLLTLFAYLGLPQGLFRGFYLDNADDENRKKMAGAMYALIGLISVGMAGVLFSLRSEIGPLVFGGGYNAVWFTLAILAFVFSTFQQIPLAVLKTLQRAQTVVGWSLLLLIINASAAILLVVVLKKGLSGLLLAYCIGHGITMLVQFPSTRSWHPLNAEFRRLKPLFAFGLPSLPNLAARNLLETANRYILPRYHGLSELATLTMAYKITGIVSTLLLLPYTNAFLPFIYSQAANRDAPTLFGRVCYYMAIALCLLFLSIETFKTILISLLGGPQYADAAPVVTVAMIGLVFSGMQAVISAGIHIKKKIPQESAIMVASSCISILCNFLLIPRFKASGAAAAVAVGFFCFLAGSFVLARKYYKVVYPYRKIGIVFLCAAACWVAIQVSPGLLVRAATLACFPILLISFDRSLLGDIRSLAMQIENSVRKKSQAAPPSDGITRESGGTAV